MQVGSSVPNAGKGPSHSSLSGRLACLCPDPGEGPPRHSSSPFPGDLAGAHGELQQELPHTQPGCGVPRDGIGLPADVCLPVVAVGGRHAASSQKGRKLPYSLFLRLTGMLTAASAVVPLGLQQLRPLRVWMNGLQLDSRRHKHRRVRVSRQCLLALRQWRSRAYLTTGVPLGVIPSHREVAVTDASASGWGAVWRRRTVRGLWSKQPRQEHINVLELRTIFLALRHFLAFLRGQHILVRSDNILAVFHVNHQGGTRSARSLWVARQLHLKHCLWQSSGIHRTIVTLVTLVLFVLYLLLSSHLA